jgi:hypothetical protein
VQKHKGPENLGSNNKVLVNICSTRISQHPLDNKKVPDSLSSTKKDPDNLCSTRRFLTTCVVQEDS